MFLVTWKNRFGTWNTEEYQSVDAAMRRVEELRVDGRNADWRPNYDPQN